MKELYSEKGLEDAQKEYFRKKDREEEDTLSVRRKRKSSKKKKKKKKKGRHKSTAQTPSSAVVYETMARKGEHQQKGSTPDTTTTTNLPSTTKLALEVSPKFEELYLPAKDTSDPVFFMNGVIRDFTFNADLFKRVTNIEVSTGSCTLIRPCEERIMLRTDLSSFHPGIRFVLDDPVLKEEMRKVFAYYEKRFKYIHTKSLDNQMLRVTTTVDYMQFMKQFYKQNPPTKKWYGLLNYVFGSLTLISSRRLLTNGEKVTVRCYAKRVKSEVQYLARVLRLSPDIVWKNEKQQLDNLPPLIRTAKTTFKRKSDDKEAEYTPKRFRSSRKPKSRIARISSTRFPRSAKRTTNYHEIDDDKESYASERSLNIVETLDDGTQHIVGATSGLNTFVGRHIKKMKNKVFDTRSSMLKLPNAYRDLYRLFSKEQFKDIIHSLMLSGVTRARTMDDGDLEKFIDSSVTGVISLLYPPSVEEFHGITRSVDREARRSRNISNVVDMTAEEKEDKKNEDKGDTIADSDTLNKILDEKIAEVEKQQGKDKPEDTVTEDDKADINNEKASTEEEKRGSEKDKTENTVDKTHDDETNTQNMNTVEKDQDKTILESTTNTDDIAREDNQEKRDM